MIARVARVGIRMLVAAAILWAVISIPLPVQDAQLVVMLRIPIAIFVFIVYIGKTLYDTFFYEGQR